MSLLLHANHAKTSIRGSILKRKLGMAKRWERYYRWNVNLGIERDGDWWATHYFFIE